VSHKILYTSNFDSMFDDRGCIFFQYKIALKPFLYNFKLLALF